MTKIKLQIRYSKNKGSDKKHPVGQITVPMDAINKLDLKKGDVLDARVSHGVIRYKPVVRMKRIDGL